MCDSPNFLNQNEEVPTRSGQGQIIKSTDQKTTNHDTVVINIENVQTNDICRINIPEDTPAYINSKTAQNHQELTVLSKEHKTTDETIQIKTTEDLTIATIEQNETDLKTNQDKVIDEDVLQKKSVVNREEQIGEWVFMYQQPQAYPQYPSQYPPGYGHQQGGYSMNERPQPMGNPIYYQGGNRNDFVQKVFAICAVMLLFTVIFVTISYTSHGIRRFLRTTLGIFILIVAFMGLLSVQYVYCLSNCSRVVPINYLLNVVVMLCFSYIAAYTTVKFAPVIVIGAAATTLAVTLLCLGLAYTSFDFTKLLLIVIVAMFAVMFASIMVMVLMAVLHVKLTAARLVILIISSVLSSVMMVIEFQMILGGKSVEIGEEDYAFAAFLMYTSILSLFIKLVQIGGIVYGDD